MERTHQSGLNLRHLADSQMKTPHSSLRVTLPPLHILLCIDMQASSLYRPRLTHHSLPASFLPSIAHLTPVNPFTYPRTSYLSFAPLLSFPSIRPNHLSPFEVMESSTPNLRSVRPSLPLPDLYSVTSSTFHPCSFTAVLNILALSFSTVHPPPPTHTSPSVPSCAPSRQWCSLLLMLLCKPTLTAT